MRIDGIIDRQRKRVHIVLPVIYESNPPVLVKFVVDTGASSTSLGFLDVENLANIDVNTLPSVSQTVIGVGGNVDTRVLKGNIILLKPDGNILENYTEITTTIPKIKIKGRNVDIHDPKYMKSLAAAFPSLLGMDIISKGALYINFSENVAYLDI